MEAQDTAKNLKLMPSLLSCKCPRCRVGKVFENGPYNLSGQKMRISCAHCGLTFEKEPGYFYAAMYVVYAFIVAELVTTAIATSVITGSDNPWLYVTVMLSITFLLSPLNFRYSRMLLMYFLTPGLRYHPEMS